MRKKKLIEETEGYMISVVLDGNRETIPISFLSKKDLKIKRVRLFKKVDVYGDWLQIGEYRVGSKNLLKNL